MEADCCCAFPRPKPAMSLRLPRQPVFPPPPDTRPCTAPVNLAPDQLRHGLPHEDRLGPAPRAARGRNYHCVLEAAGNCALAGAPVSLLGWASGVSHSHRPTLACLPCRSMTMDTRQRSPALPRSWSRPQTPRATTSLSVLRRILSIARDGASQNGLVLKHGLPASLNVFFPLGSPQAKGGPPRVSVPQQPAAKPQSQSQSQSQPQRGAAASAPRAPAPSAATGIRRLPVGAGTRSLIDGRFPCRRPSTSPRPPSPLSSGWAH